MVNLQMLESYYGFIDKYVNRQDFELRYMDTDSFYLGMRGHSLDEIVNLGLRQVYEIDRKIGLQQRILAREHLDYLTLNLLVKELCGLLLSAIFFRIKI